MPRTRLALAIIVAAGVAACATDSPAGGPTRETLPNGALLVRYPDLPAIDSVGPEVTDVQVDLKLGSRDGADPNFIFGEIGGIQVASDGTIYVLDNQALEVRVFSSEGDYLRTIVRRGEGPGEILRSNGIILSGDTLLWINETRQWAIIGVDPAGEELRRFTSPVRDRGYLWDGTFDRRGRYWTTTSHADEGELVEPEPGLHTSGRREYYKSYDLSTEAVDSVFLREYSHRTHIAELPGGVRTHSAIPFEAFDLTVAYPSGGFWNASTGSYRLTRTLEGGDTVIVIEAELPAYPVTAEDRSAYVRVRVEWDPRRRRAAEEAVSLAPDVKPILEGFFVDDEGRLWVQRVVPADAPPFYDLFSEDGDYLNSVRLAFRPELGATLWVQHGSIYTCVLDELDVPYVARAPLS